MTTDLEKKWAIEALAKQAAEVYAANGKILPRPDESGQLADPLTFRRELIRGVQYNSRFAKTDLSKVPASELDRIEQQVYADAAQNALQPLDLRPGELRKIERTDSTGRRITEFASGRGPGAFRAVFGEHMAQPLESPIHDENGVVKTARITG